MLWEHDRNMENMFSISFRKLAQRQKKGKTRFTFITKLCQLAYFK